jgi:hypothetical protein
VAIDSNAIAIRGGRYSIALMVMDVVPRTAETSVLGTAPLVAATKPGHNPIDNQQNSNGRKCMLELSLWAAKQF